MSLQTTVHPDIDGDEGEESYTLPAVEALMAGTLALLTGYAQSAPHCKHRAPMASKLVDNLQLLGRHPQLSAAMRRMLGNLCTRWQLELERTCPDSRARQPTPLWHGAPQRLQ